MAPSAPAGRQLRGPRQEWSAIRGSLRPPLAHAHAPLLAQVAAPLRVPAAAGGAPPWAGGRRGGGTKAGAVAYSAPPTGLPGKWSWLIPWCCSTFWKLFLSLRGTPWCFRLLRKLHSPASPRRLGRGAGGAGEAKVSAAPTTPWGWRRAREARKPSKAAFKVTKPPRALSTPQGARGPEGSARQLKGGSQEGEH